MYFLNYFLMVYVIKYIYIYRERERERDIDILCMFSTTNLLNIHWISDVKKIIGTKTDVHNLESLYL